MATIPGSGFMMGSYDRYDNEQPAHQVIISEFLMGKTEVTQLQYQSVVGRNPSAFRQGSLAMLHPVENVCWYDAVLFCNLLSQKENLAPCYYADAEFTTVWMGQGKDVFWKLNALGYRLPTEAEWEYAARGGLRKDVLFPGGLEADAVAWFGDNSGTEDEPGLKSDWMAEQQNWSHKVGLKAANGFGLFDTSGNVREWCWDWLGRYYNKTVTDPTGAQYGSGRVLRGGGFASGSKDITLSARSQSLAGARSPIFGFRIARSLPKPPAGK